MNNDVTYTFGSYNILDPQYARAHPPAHVVLPANGTDWNARKATVLNNLQTANLDVYAIQEISIDAFRDLQASLAALGYAGKHARHENKPDGVALFYKTAVFNEKDVRTLVHDSSAVGGKTTQRRALYMDLEDTTTGRVMRFASVHLEGGPNRAKGDQQLREIKTWLESSKRDQNYAVDGVAMAGDLNRLLTRPSGGSAYLSSATPVGSSLLKDYRFDEARGESEIGTGKRIDHIAVLHNSHPLIVDRDFSHLTAASDHHLIGAEIRFRATVLNPPVAPAPAPVAPAPIASPAAPAAPAPVAPTSFRPVVPPGPSAPRVAPRARGGILQGFASFFSGLGNLFSRAWNWFFG